VGGGRFLWPLSTSLLFGILYGMNHLVMEYPTFVIGPLAWLPWLPLFLLYGLFNLRLLRVRRAGSAWVSALEIQEKEAVR
jgi:hypothetical protein